MATSTENRLRATFNQIFGGEPPADKLAFWVNAVDNGFPLEKLRQQMATSPAAQQISSEQAAAGPQIGLVGAEDALQRGLTGALSGLTEGIGAATQTLDPFAQQGGQALNLQAALSGALGPEAQAQAFTDFQDSPGQQFLQERGERAILRNQSALGGLGGGLVQQELQRQGIGLARQDFADQFNRLGPLSSIGFGAAGQQAGFQNRGGQTAAELAFQTGRDLAGGRTRAGEQLAGAIGGTTSALSSLANQQGTGISQLTGQAGSNLANLLSGAGQQQAGGQTQLAGLLANLSTQQGSQVAGLPSIPGTQQTRGIIDSIGQAASGAGTAMAAFSDSRLKENIEKIGVTDKGHNLYTWDWNEIGLTKAGDSPTIGVIAQEALKKDPSLVSIDEDGYLMVDYSRVY